MILASIPPISNFISPGASNRANLKFIMRTLRSNPTELFRLLNIGLTTLKFRFLIRTTGNGTIVEPGTRMVNPANIHIGSHCLIKEQVYLRAGLDGSIRISDRVALNSFCRIFGHGGVTIGMDSQIGPGCLITTTGHDYTSDLAAKYQPVAIGISVWMGARVTVLPGVTVGDGAVIGAGAVVHRDLPAGTLAVGVPARVVKALPRHSPANRD